MAHLTSASSEGAEGHDVEERDHQVPEHRGGRQEDPEDDHHEVPGETRCQFDRQQLDVAIRDVLAHQWLSRGRTAVAPARQSVITVWASQAAQGGPPDM